MRKKILCLLVWVAGLLVTANGRAIAETACQQTPQGTLCTSEVNFTQFTEQAYMSQLQSQWCWAASISMLYAYYGHPVSQSRIVTEVYGSEQNLPAMAGITIANQLNRCWTDDNGDSFTSRVTGAYDPQFGVYTLTNAQIVSELDQDHPMIIGARTHAMVLTLVQYFQTPSGPNIVAAGVFDPWPGIGARALEMDELYPIESGGSLRFAATARIVDRVDECPVPPELPEPGTDPYAGGCSVPGDDYNVVMLVVIGAGFLLLGRRRLHRYQDGAR